MSFVDKLKSVFIVSDPASDAKNDAGNIQASSSDSNTGSPEIAADMSSESTDKFRDILLQVLDSNNQPGFDYLEFRKAVESIAKLQNLEEAAQFKTAYAAAMSMNVQPGQLIESANKYLSVLETEYIKFNQTASQYLQTQVNSKEQESTELQKTIQNKESELAQLQSELDKHRKRIIEIDAELKSAKSKVEVNKSSFKSAYDQLVGQIGNDIRKMEQYLK